MKRPAALKGDARLDFIIPLSRQAVALVQAAMAASRSPKWLFPGVGDWRKPISESTMSKLYRESGFTDKHVPHVWRATFSTIMNERAALANRPGDRHARGENRLLLLGGATRAVPPQAAGIPPLEPPQRPHREQGQGWAPGGTDSQAYVLLLPTEFARLVRGLLGEWGDGEHRVKAALRALECALLGAKGHPKLLAVLAADALIAPIPCHCHALAAREVASAAPMPDLHLANYQSAPPVRAQRRRAPVPHLF